MEIKENFYLNQIKQDELEMLLLTYFGKGVHIYESKSIYHKEEADKGFSVTISYDSKGKIQSIKSGSKLKKEDVNEIRQKIYNELVDAQEVVVGRDICFVTGSKVEGYFTYKDTFQVLPLPPDAPQIDNQMWGHHPILLEYKYTSSKNDYVNGFRKIKKFQEIILILHLLSRGRFHGSASFGQFDWVIIRSEDPEKITSKFKQIGYYYVKPFQAGNQFSSTEGISKIEFGESKLNELTLVEDTNNLLDIIFSLETGRYLKFIISCYWLYMAKKAWEVSYSISYVCLVTSVECLMNDTEKCRCGSAVVAKSIEICHICGEPRYRLGKSFKEFLEKYSGEEYAKLSNEKKNDIYNIRSTMLHGGRVFSIDSEPLGFLGYQKSYDETFYRTILSLVPKALLKWLSLNKN